MLLNGCTLLECAVLILRPKVPVSDHTEIVAYFQHGAGVLVVAVFDSFDVNENLLELEG